MYLCDPIPLDNLKKHTALLYITKNTLKKERQEETQEKYPWLDPSNERKCMTDREILEKYIDLEKSYLTDKEKKEVMDILYEYNKAFSLRDEVGICQT